MSTNEMHEIIRKLKEYKLLKEEAEAIISELEGQIKSEMKALEIDTLINGEYKCKLTTVNTNRLDGKALQAAHPEIYVSFVKPSSYERLTVK